MTTQPIRRVGIIFSGGPAPAANAVISAAATSFLSAGIEVVGFFHGYSNLVDYHPVTNRLLPGRHYRILTEHDVQGLRNQRGIILGTARTNPGRNVKKAAHLADPTRTEPIRHVYEALVDLEIDALVSIGGDDTLKTANHLVRFQTHLPPEARRVRVVHLPKTIDNDYRGIDFTFGFFTAVDVMAKELLNLRADAMATASYFVVETMGRKAGWLAYGVAIAGEATRVICVEDAEAFMVDRPEGRRVDLQRLVDHLLDVVQEREANGYHHGLFVLAEGLSELLPDESLSNVERDAHGHISLGNLNLGRVVANALTAGYSSRTGRVKKCKSVQLGYESRCAEPHAFDVMLGSQLGIGAYRALCEEGLNGHMVSVSGQLDLVYVPFEELVDPETLVTEVRFIKPGSDFHRLARFLEARGEKPDWLPARAEPKSS